MGRMLIAEIKVLAVFILHGVWVRSASSTFGLE